MKLKILNIGVALGGENIENSEFDKADSFSDYDAVIINPDLLKLLYSGIGINSEGIRNTFSESDRGFGAKLSKLVERRSEEIAHLLSVTGGIVVCFLYPEDKGINYYYYSGSHRYSENINCYSWLPYNIYRYPVKQEEPFTGKFKTYLREWPFPSSLGIKERKGEYINLINKSHPFVQYFNAFPNDIRFEAVVDNLPDTLIPSPTIIAKNKVGEIVSFELPFSKGSILFIPPVSNPDRNKLGGVLENCIKSRLQTFPSSPPPPWIKNYSLSGENKNQEELAKIDEQLVKLQSKKNKLLEEQNEIILLKGLLYEKGKFTLEPIVRKAFRIIGFKVFEPKDYEEPYNLYMSKDNHIIIGEIEGTESKQMSVEKYRQLLDYVQDYLLKKGEAKGILVANANINEDPEKRGEQFTKEVIKGCESQGYCRITTFELYKIIKSLLSLPLEKREVLRKKIRKEIFSCKGEYKFVDNNKK